MSLLIRQAGTHAGDLGASQSLIGLGFLLLVGRDERRALGLGPDVPKDDDYRRLILTDVYIVDGALAGEFCSERRVVPHKRISSVGHGLN